MTTLYYINTYRGRTSVHSKGTEINLWKNRKQGNADERTGHYYNETRRDLHSVLPQRSSCSRSPRSWPELQSWTCSRSLRDGGDRSHRLPPASMRKSSRWRLKGGNSIGSTELNIKIFSKLKVILNIPYLQSPEQLRTKPSKGWWWCFGQCSGRTVLLSPSEAQMFHLTSLEKKMAFQSNY